MQNQRVTTKDECLNWLSAHAITHDTREHDALHTVEEAQAARALWGPPWDQGGQCKNLFLKDKKGALFLIVTLENRPLRLNSLGNALGAARLSFSTADLLWEVLGVRPGSVTPFALINDPEARVTAVFDAPMLEHDRLHYHPLDNRYTTAISRNGLLALAAATGHTPMILDLVKAAGGDSV
jgi:Ala-tRNA(Pro) deacylase